MWRTSRAQSRAAQPERAPCILIKLDAIEMNEERAEPRVRCLIAQADLGENEPLIRLDKRAGSGRQDGLDAAETIEERPQSHAATSEMMNAHECSIYIKLLFCVLAFLIILAHYLSSSLRAMAPGQSL